MVIIKKYKFHIFLILILLFLFIIFTLYNNNILYLLDTHRVFLLLKNGINFFKIIIIDDLKNNCPNAMFEGDFILLIIELEQL